MNEDDEITVLDDGDEEDSNLQMDENIPAPLDHDYNEPASIQKTTDAIQEEPPSVPIDQMAEITKNTTQKKKKKESKGTVLDKFKRRLVRVIARMIREGSYPTDEVWEDLKNQTGCDCKLLWDRMNVLATKKLKRLFTSEDIVENVTSIARMAVTDWLLFDLVLVHEKIDVIGLDEPEYNDSPQILEDLFHLVIQFKLESLSGDLLTRAWFAATKQYNGKIRQCSPMLLQRRWYQLKETVRDKFYRFWFSYRGTAHLLDAAYEYKPTDLEMRIVEQFKYIATKPFPSWEKLIEEKKVSLPEDFERLQLAKRKILRDENEPDIEVIEPQVETIDLELESDSEESRDSTALREKGEDGNLEKETVTSDPNISTSTSQVNLDIVKNETDISDEDDVCILESIDIPIETNINVEAASDLSNNYGSNDVDLCTETIDSKDTNFNIDNSLESGGFTQSTSCTMIENVLLKEQSNGDDSHGKTSNLVESENDIEMVMPIITNISAANMSNDFEIAMPKIASVTSAAMLTDEPAEDDTVHNEINVILENVAENIIGKQLFHVPLHKAVINNTTNNISAPDIMENTDELVKKIIDEEIDHNIKESELNCQNETISDSYKNQEIISNNKITNEITIDLDTEPINTHIFEGIELEDDGIEYIEEDEDHIKENKLKEIEVEETDENGKEGTPTIDLKLLLNPIVYTKKLDHMDVFRFIDYDVVKDKRVIENADSESKPVDRNSVKMEEIAQDRLPTPNSDIFRDSASEYCSDDDSYPELISPSSWLLNKPRNLSYNPIQLCKNPDFNTRLKRLTAGFFTSMRNRMLLKQCKPVTIELHKAFESKLVNNTLYLVKQEFLESKQLGTEITVEKSVPPSAAPLQNLIDNVVNDFLKPTPSSPLALPIQNLINNVVNDFLDPVPEPSSIKQCSTKPVIDGPSVERNKVINLPDIAQVRRLNERLLTAEVTPIQASNIIKPPVSILSVDGNLENNSQDSGTLGNITTSITNNENSTSSTLVSDRNSAKSNVSSDSNINSLSNRVADNAVSNTLSSAPKPPKNKNTLYRPLNPWYKKDLKKKLPRETEKKFLIPEDRHLTADTVDKIISICMGLDTISTKNDKKKVKQMKNPFLSNKDMIQTQKEISEISNESEVSFVGEQVTVETENTNHTPIENQSNNTQLDSVLQRNRNVKKKKKPITRKMNRINELQIKTKYCCWARERIENFYTKRKCQRHRCPQPLCQCCCRQDLIQKMLTKPGEDKNRSQWKEVKIPSENKILKEIDKPSENKILKEVNTPAENEILKEVNIPSENEIVQNSNSLNKKPIKITICTPNRPSKASIGTNTDFDKDFEAGYAVNLANINSSSLSVDSDNQILTNITDLGSTSDNSVFCQTQTFANMNISNVNSKQDSSFSNLPKSQYLRKVGAQNFYPNPGGAQLRDGAPNNILLQERNEKLDKVLFLRNDKIKKPFFRSPICLGKNKILLCSFEKINLKKQLELNNVEQTQNHFTLPEGVRIVLMPNKELALSIDPGIELDSNQLAYLPAVMASVQQQLDAAENLVTSDTDNTKTKSVSNEENVQLESDINLNYNDSAPLPETSCGEQLDNTDDNIVQDGNKSKEVNNDNHDANVAEVQDTPPLNKKTILSDLMEMSGITTEDTHATNKESPVKQKPELGQSPSIQKLIALHSNEPNEILNNPLFQNPIVETVLSRCPELSIVFSYQELKYALANNAQFYKLDIVTGVIIPINLLIKKQVNQVKSKPCTLSKAVIDLTDEAEDDEQVQSIDTNKEDENINSLEISDKEGRELVVPVKLFSAFQASILRRGKSLLRTGKSDHNYLPTKKRRTICQRRKIQTLECSESIDLDSDSEIVSDKTNYSAGANSEIISDKANSDNDFDSDDEPLALKAKRKKKSNDDTTEQNIQFKENYNINENAEMDVETTVDPNLAPNNNTISNDMVPDEIHGNLTSDSEPMLLMPVDFEDNTPESDDDCILGV